MTTFNDCELCTCVFKDLEKKNESQQESLKKFHQEQRTLLDKVNMLQQQLSQVFLQFFHNWTIYLQVCALHMCFQH